MKGVNSTKADERMEQGVTRASDSETVQRKVPKRRTLRPTVALVYL